MNEIEKQFKSKAIIKGEIMLFSIKNALSFVEECRKNKISILGIDAFFLFDEKIQPSQENSIDFSSSYYVQKTDSIYSDAINFLKHKNDQLFFEIICSD
ncbi:hypothetical protein [Leptospira alexanderi]|uniref:hypothetical protein n=1 Tax=Leptospira alexanderi TaxID=100053 RepID=UPI0009913625|nr:hypothetical protein [Leptospira alexanderi]